MAVANLFVSAVSAEFANYREALRRDLTRTNVSVAVQDDFVASGTETLDKLDDYLRTCDAVIHIVGDMTGAVAMAPSVAVIRARYSDMGQRFPAVAPFLASGGPGLPYTQWEAWLALYHRRHLIICAPEASAPRHERYRADDAERNAQREHLARLASIERFVEIRFADAASLAIEVLRSSVADLVRRGGAAPRNLPQRPSPFFTGRDALMDALAHALGAPPRDGSDSATLCVLSGMGGVGKSRLALEFAWAHARDYAALLFLDASDGDALRRSLAGLVAPQVLDLPEHHDPEQEAQVGAVLRWLDAHPGWLLIADNVDSEGAAAAVEPRLAPLVGGHVLVTSRLGKDRWGGSVDVRPVLELDRADAAAFLLKRTEGHRRPRDDDVERAGAIAGELQGLPLALEQAGAYIAKFKLTLEGYLQQWMQNRDKLLGWFDPRVTGYPRSADATWQTSVAQLSPPAMRLLQRLAWLAPEPVPESLLAAGSADGDIVPADGLDALAELASLSLVRRDDVEPQFAIHGLVQEVTRAGMHGSRRCEVLAEALAWMNEAFVDDTQDVRNWPRLDPLLPHAEAVASWADKEGASGPISRLMSQAALLLIVKAMHAQAEPLMRRALANDEASLGPDHPDVAIDLNNLAHLLSDTNRIAEAEPLMRRALAIDEASFGPEDTNVARELNNLGSLLKATNRFAEAEPLMRRALAIDEAGFGAESPAVARDLNNLAQLLQATNRLAEAEPLMRRALAIDETGFGPESPAVARDLGNLALLLQATNRLAEAEPLMRRALAIDETSFGPEHPEVATDLNNLASLLEATDRSAEPETLMRRALAIDESSFGPEHPNVAIDLNNLAMRMRRNRLAGAEPLMRRALAIDEASFGPESPAVARDLSNLALLLEDSNRLAEAEPLMRRALAIDEASFGPEHPDVARHLNNLAQLLQATNRLAEAEPLLRRALAIDEASFGLEHPDVATHLNNLAQLLHASNRLAEAEPLMRRALAIDEASFGPESPDVATHLNNLALMLQTTDRLAEAEPLMRRALAIDEASFGPESPAVARDLSNLALLLQATNRLAEAEPLMRRALVIDEASFGPKYQTLPTVQK
jgi:tetratricopeptide (TPR) repeat protein